MLTVEYGSSGALSGGYTVVLGGFDGVHVGHESLIRFAKEQKNPVAVMTIFGKKDEFVLFNRSERERILKNLGADVIYTVSMTDEIRQTSWQDFLLQLQSDLSVVAIVCGEDFRFGKNAEGDAEKIRKQTALPVCSLPLVYWDGEKVSSSSVRRWIECGNIQKANELLANGSRFCVTGTVQRGRAVGRTLGFPTANIDYPTDKVQLLQGVYAVRVNLNGKSYRGIANVGKIPTFGIEKPTFEAYIDGFSGDLYGRLLCVEIEQFIRPIVKFDGAEALKAQLMRDLEVIR